MSKEWADDRARQQEPEVEAPVEHEEATLGAEQAASDRQRAVFRRAKPGEEAAGGVDAAMDAADASSGRPMDAAVRGSLAPTFGDVSDVRVHDDPHAHEAANAIGAEAFTRGQDIFFGEGEHQPGTAAGDDLIAHETAHAVQQRGASGEPDKAVSAPGDAVEQEADAAAAAHKRGEPAALASAAAGVSRKAIMARPKKGADDDWQVTRTDPDSFSPLIAGDPARDQVDLKLGGTWATRWHVANELPKSGGITFFWRHKAKNAVVQGDLGSTSGPSSKGTYMATHVGQGTATTELTQRGPGKKVKTIDGPETVLSVARPAGKIANMYSESERGKLPVTGVMQEGETLHAEVHMTGVDDKLDHATAAFEGSGFVVQNVYGIGGGIFQVTLKPTKVGKVEGTLDVMPGQAKKDDVDGDRLSLTVEKMTSKTDYGSRPKSTADALHRLERAWNRVFEDRDTGTNTAFLQMKEKDPPPKTPLWKSLLIGAAKMALDAATAGIGARIAAGAMEILEHEGEGLKEFVKNVAEKTINAGIDSGLETIGGGEVEKSEGGAKLSLANKFYQVQHLTLSQSKESTIDKVMTTAEAEAEDRDKKQTDGFKDSGQGYKFVNALAASVDKMAGDAAAHEQYVKTFGAWCSLQAQNAIGSEKGVTEEEKADPGKSVEHGTDMSKLVDAQKVVRHAQGASNYGVIYKDAEGIDKTPGVLRFELYLSGRGNPAPFFAKNARIEGLDNDAFAQTAARIAIRDLDMPIIASFNDDQDAGFVVGRNEVREYWGSTTGKDILSKRYPGMSAKDAAKKILDEEMGDKMFAEIKRG